MTTAHEACAQAARRIDAAHEAFERYEIDLEAYRAVVVGERPPCDDRTCPTCFRQDESPEAAPMPSERPQRRK